MYGGTAPFTEPEAAVVRDVFDRYDNQIKLYVAIHSYGQYFLYPWGYDLYVVISITQHTTKQKENGKPILEYENLISFSRLKRQSG